MRIIAIKEKMMLVSSKALVQRVGLINCFDVNIDGHRSYNKQGRNYDTKAKGFKY